MRDRIPVPVPHHYHCDDGIQHRQDERSASQLANNYHVGPSISTSVSSQETVEIIAPPISEPREDVEVNGVNLGAEMRLQEFLLDRASSTSSSSVAVITCKEGAYHDQAKQKTLLPRGVRSKAGADDSTGMALQLSMDTALTSEDTLVTGSQTCNFKKIVRSHKHPLMISIKKKTRTDDTLYLQALQNVNDALAPPFPNSKPT